jgi:hypothetical protein
MVRRQGPDTRLEEFPGSMTGVVSRTNSTAKEGEQKRSVAGNLRRDLVLCRLTREVRKKSLLVARARWLRVPRRAVAVHSEVC